MEKPIIKASWLGPHEYCEYKWYLENVLKQEIPITQPGVRGKDIHQKKKMNLIKKFYYSTFEDFNHFCLKRSTSILFKSSLLP